MAFKNTSILTFMKILSYSSAWNTRIRSRNNFYYRRLVPSTTIFGSNSNIMPYTTKSTRVLLQRYNNIDDDTIENMTLEENKEGTTTDLSCPSTSIAKTSLTPNREIRTSTIVTPDEESHYQKEVIHTSKRRRAVRNIITTTIQTDEPLVEKLVLSTSTYKKVSVIVNNNTSTDGTTASTSSSSNTNENTKKKIVRKKIPTIILPPDNWESVYSLVEELRQDKSAPVDAVGAEVLPERHRGDVIFRFQVLISLMLSSQTKDAVVGETMKALQKHGLDVQSINETPTEKLNDLIKKVGFHNKKAKYIKQTTQIILQTYNSDIPDTIDDILTLPGIGPKMGYIIESIAFGRTSGIGVDTHMHRVFNQLSWVDTNTAEQTRKQLERWLPKDKWSTVNKLFVGFGQEVQQQKEKSVRKALGCSRPLEALMLLEMVGLDYRKECKKFNLEEKMEMVSKRDV